MNMKKTLTAAAIGTTLLCAPLSSLAATVLSYTQHASGGFDVQIQRNFTD